MDQSQLAFQTGSEIEQFLSVTSNVRLSVIGNIGTESSIQYNTIQYNEYF